MPDAETNNFGGILLKKDKIKLQKQLIRLPNSCKATLKFHLSKHKSNKTSRINPHLSLNVTL